MEFPFNIHACFWTIRVQRRICCLGGGRGQKSGFSSNEPSGWREKGEQWRGNERVGFHVFSSKWEAGLEGDRLCLLLICQPVNGERRGEERGESWAHRHGSQREPQAINFAIPDLLSLQVQWQHTLHAKLRLVKTDSIVLYCIEICIFRKKKHWQKAGPVACSTVSVSKAKIILFTSRFPWRCCPLPKMSCLCMQTLSSVWRLTETFAWNVREARSQFKLHVCFYFGLNGCQNIFIPNAALIENNLITSPLSSEQFYFVGINYYTFIEENM